MFASKSCAASCAEIFGEGWREQCLRRARNLASVLSVGFGCLAICRKLTGYQLARATCSGASKLEILQLDLEILYCFFWPHNYPFDLQNLQLIFQHSAESAGFGLLRQETALRLQGGVERFHGSIPISVRSRVCVLTVSLAHDQQTAS